MRNPLHALCPYFAMFPEEFVREQTLRHTRRGDLVFDCFSGRGTTALEALLLDRRAAAIDVNPVAFCISAAKAQLPDPERLQDRIDDLQWFFEHTARPNLKRERRALPIFFGRAFHWHTLEQILFLRWALKWKGGRTDRFIAALVLGSLHGDMDRSQSYCSNQMPRTISTKPGYSLSYWRKNALWPRRRNVFEVLRERAELRFAGSQPSLDGNVVMGDARQSGRLFRDLRGQVKAIITSPPYYNVTNFEEDQWLRLWFLGHEPNPTYRTISPDDRYRCQDTRPYWSFLESVWRGVKPLLRPGAVIVCRLGAKSILQPVLTRQLSKTIRAVFPRGRLIEAPVVSTIRNRQRNIFQPGTTGCLFEVDYTFAISG